MAEGRIVRRAWNTIERQYTRPPYHYARTEAVLDAMERELRDSGQLADNDDSGQLPDRPTASPINEGGTMPESATSGASASTADAATLSAS